MIVLDTLGRLHEHKHELSAHCPRCGHRATLPLAELVAQGKGSLSLPNICARCGECGEPGRIQVRPIMPAWTNTNGWIGPPSFTPSRVESGARP